jgi:hypothetical protein
MLVVVGAKASLPCCQDGPRPTRNSPRAGKGSLRNYGASAEPVVKVFVQMRPIRGEDVDLSGEYRAGAAVEPGGDQGHANLLASGDTDLQEATSAPLDYADANKGKTMDRFPNC